ncbi:MAG: OFA family MFS transporter [Candidatus Sumerlaeia bacterium]|nr:OFA family MFS transporter [Candidatus Sumerlaeia bacterium]
MSASLTTSRPLIGGLTTTDLNPGWRVALAGTGVNLALGILYSWSVIAGFLRRDLGWSAMHSQLPYMIACGVFALLMVPGGRLQDRIGPRKVVAAAAVLAGLGLVGSAWFPTVVGFALFFGGLFGAAMGLGYSSTTPPAMKWFGPRRRGLVTGIVVAGFGLASVYAAPMTNSLIGNLGLSKTLLVLGVAFFIVIALLSRFIVNPPAGYVPPEEEAPARTAAGRPRPVGEDLEWHQMLRRPQFYALWGMFCFGSLAGLMIIGQLSSIAVEQSGLALGFVLVAILAVFNAGGRIVGGLLFDKLGRTATLTLIFAVQAVNFLLFALYTTPATLLLGTVLAGSCYGACLSVFPATTATLFGVRNIGVNYGLVFTAWGAGGVFGGLTGGLVRDWTGSYLNAYLIAASLCAVGTLLALSLGWQRRPAVRTATA